MIKAYIGDEVIEFTRKVSGWLDVTNRHCLYYNDETSTITVWTGESPFDHWEKVPVDRIEWPDGSVLRF